MKSKPTELHLAVLILAAAVCCVNVARAAEPNESEFLGNLPVVLSVSRLAQPLADAPGAVTVIDRDMIKASGARDIAELFRLVPGFLVSYANGANPVVNYHGMTGQFSSRMQVLIDGRSVYAPFYLGGVNWNTLAISLDDIERIEVLRGSNSAAYGANSFLGVANIITRHASQSQGTYVSYTGGNDGINDNVARYGGKLGSMYYRVTVGRRGDNGFNDINDERHVSYAGFRGDLRLNATDEMQFQMGANENSAGAGFADTPTNPMRTQYDSSYYAQVQWHRVRAIDDEMSLSAYHVENGATESYWTPLPSAANPSLVDWGRRSSQSSIEFQRIFRPGPSLRAVWGAGGRYDSMQSRVLFGPSGGLSATLVRAFGNLEWRVSPYLLINAGGMVERYSLTGTDISPRLMFNFQPSPAHTLRIGITRAYRTPSLAEYTNDMRAIARDGSYWTQVYLNRGEVSPERVLSREISYLGNYRSLNATLDVRLYREQLNDLIGLESYALPHSWPFTFPYNLLPQTTQTFANKYHALVRGGEYQLRWRPSRSTLVLLNQSFEHIVDANDVDLSRAAPTHNTTLFVSHKFANGWQGSATYSWVGAMVWTNEGDYVPAYRRFDVRLARSFRVGTCRAEVALVSQNLGQPYAEFRPAYLFTRRTFATLSLEY